MWEGGSWSSLVLPCLKARAELRPLPGSPTWVWARLELLLEAQALAVNRGYVNCSAVAAAAVLFFTSVVHLFCCGCRGTFINSEGCRIRVTKLRREKRP